MNFTPDERKKLDQKEKLHDTDEKRSFSKQLEEKDREIKRLQQEIEFLKKKEKITQKYKRSYQSPNVS